MLVQGTMLHDDTFSCTKKKDHRFRETSRAEEISVSYGLFFL